MKKIVAVLMMLAMVLCVAVETSFARGGRPGGGGARGGNVGRTGGANAGAALRNARTKRDGKADRERERSDDDDLLLRRLLRKRRCAD